MKLFNFFKREKSVPKAQVINNKANKKLIGRAVIKTKAGKCEKCTLADDDCVKLTDVPGGDVCLK